MDPGGFARYGRPRRVEGGLRARSERGDIGESWWSRRFLAALESLAIGGRLGRGRSYARAGQVLALTVAPGQVTASVQGSRPRPYRVSIRLAVVNRPTWRTIEVALAEQAVYSARLLAGEMPPEIEDVFAAAGAPLFPTNAQHLLMDCTCPDWHRPCKHIAATFYLLAEAFDDDPFQLLHWRGRDRATLLDALRKLRSGDVEPRAGRSRGRTARATSTGATPAETATAMAGGAALALSDIGAPYLAQTVERFWVSPVPLPPRPPTLDTEVDLVLRQLPTPTAAIGGSELVERLRALYAGLAGQPGGQDPQHHERGTS